MAQDFYLNPETGDINLELESFIKLCPTEAELTRQRCLINLKTFKGEWFADTLYGVPYFSQIFRKGSKAISDGIFKNTIEKTVGVVSLETYSSTLNDKTRKLTVDFSFKSESGEIINARVTF